MFYIKPKSSVFPFFWKKVRNKRKKTVVRVFLPKNKREGKQLLAVCDLSLGRCQTFPTAQKKVLKGSWIKITPKKRVPEILKTVWGVRKSEDPKTLRCSPAPENAEKLGSPGRPLHGPPARGQPLLHPQKIWLL